MAENVPIAMPLDELKSSEFMFGPKKVKTWSFVDKKKGGKLTSGSNDFCDVFYGKPGQKLAVVLEDVATIGGVQTTDNFKRSFMSLKLTKEQSDKIRRLVDEPIFRLAFEHRERLFKQGRKIQHAAEMKFLFHGVVQDGKEKKDKGPDGKTLYWDDGVSGNITMKKKDQQHIVDPAYCEIIDLEGHPYPWTSLDGKKLREVIIEVEKIVFSDKIRVHCCFRSIVPNETGGGAVKYTTKRRLEQKEAAAAAPPAADVPPPTHAGAPPAADASTPPSAKVDAPSAVAKDDGGGKRRKAE